MGAFTLWHELLNLDDKDGTSRAIPQPPSRDSPQPPSAAAPMLQQHFFPREAGATSSPALQLLLVSRAFACSSCPGVSWRTATHPWERDLLPAGGGQSSEQARWAVVPPKLAAAGLSHPRVPHQNSCYGKRFVDFFLFLLFFFFSSCAQTSPDLLRRTWHIILQMWHRSLGCKIYPAWQLAVLCNLYQLTETTVRYS